jgi:hypothetical protein
MKRVVAAVVVALAWLVACAAGDAGPTAGVETNTPDRITTDGGSPETGTNSGCVTGQTLCNSKCVDTKNDVLNCGTCGTSCGGDGGGGWECTNGTCSCAQSKTACNGACVDTQTDIANCGGCGSACAGTCMAGHCCTTGQQSCNNACTDVLHDSNNCGDCGVTCANGEKYCGNGMCFPNGEYSQTFTQNQPAPQQCTAWNAFRDNLDETVKYTGILLEGKGGIAVLCSDDSDPGTANDLCQALKAGRELSVQCHFRRWIVGVCGAGGVAVSSLSLGQFNAGGDACTCETSQGYSARPCNAEDWGGIEDGTPGGAVTCNAKTQRINVKCLQ